MMPPAAGGDGSRPITTASAITTYIQDHTPANRTHSEVLHHLALQILHNLEHQHRWTALKVHTTSTVTSLPLPRPVLSGLPPRRLYIHPDEQIDLLHTETTRKEKEIKTRQDGEGMPGSLPETNSIQIGLMDVQLEREWVLPTHLRENWSLAHFAEVFDGIGIVPPLDAEEGGAQVEQFVNRWRNTKRMVLATLQDDSTVVYYIVHDGIVKPRQN